MATKSKLKEVYEPEAKFGAFYTGGNVEWHENHLYCQNTTHISKVNIETGIVTDEIAKTSEDIETDCILTFTASDTYVITAHKSGLFKLWNTSNELEKQWKYIHKGPVASLSLYEDTLLSGGSDGIVRVWNIAHQACTSALKGCTGVVNVLTHHNDAIFASGDDGNILAWEKGIVKQSYSGHFSKVTCIKFTNDGEHFVSSGRDKVLILWKVNSAQAVRTVPVYQTIEGILIMSSKATLPCGKLENKDDIIVACAGEKGAVSIWNVKISKELYKQENSLINSASVEGSVAITHLLSGAKGKQFALVSAEHNIIIHRRKTFEVVKQLVGFSDEILDVAYCGTENEYLAVATNSNDIKLFHSASMNCQLLRGHTDIVMALGVTPFNKELLASCGKDNTVRLWLLSSARCVALGVRHTSTVSTLCCFNAAKFLVTGSQDNCIKLWDLTLPAGFVPEREATAPVELNATRTEIAHAKDINALAVSPNDKLLASCSQDKTIKLWTESLTLLGILKGHKRGVWCCRFSPVDQVLVSSSADCTIKLWSINELNCLKTIEGHDASVLRVDFLSHGMQLLSCGADGLVKLFDVKSSECQLTLEEHDGRIWSVSVAEDESHFVTGGSDSLLIKWKDVTELKKDEKLKELEEEAREEQKLANYLQQDQLLKALKLGLKLNKPYTVLRIIQGVIKKGEPLAGSVEQLASHEKETLLKCASDWNTNSRNCQPAQLVLYLLLQEVQVGSFRPSNLASVVEGNLAYTQRHYRRLTDLMQDLHFIDYTVKRMQPFAPN